MRGPAPRPPPGREPSSSRFAGPRILFQPSGGLPAGANVHVHVEGVTDFDLLPLAVPVDFQFTVAAAEAVQPFIARVEPASGLADQYTAAVVRGAGFRSGDVVRIGTQLAEVRSIATDAIEIVVPPSTDYVSGPVTVAVEDPAGLRAVRVGGFVYRDRLKLVSLTPDRTSQAGGIKVDLTGYGFAPGMKVDFGGTLSFDVQVAAANRATAVAPPHASGFVDVTATLGSQATTKARAFLYGTGAVARLDTPPVAHLVVDGGVAYAALGAELDVTGADGTVYAAGVRAPAGLLIADVSEPTHVVVKKQLSFDAPAAARRVVKTGSLLYVAADTAGVRVLDVSLPDAPVALEALTSTDAAGHVLRVNDVAASGDLVFVADADGVLVYRVGEVPGRAIRTTRRSLPGGANALAVHGTLLLVSSGTSADAQFRVYDARTGDLAELGSVAIAGPARHIAAEGTRAFVALGRLGEVAIIDLADPTAPAGAGAIRVENAVAGGPVSAEQVVPAGEIVWVAAGEGKLQRFRVPIGGVATGSGTVAAALLERASVLGDATSVALMGTHLLAGTVFLDAQGTPVDIPVASAADAAFPLAGGLASLALDHIELRGTRPASSTVFAIAEPLEVFLSAIPDPATAAAVVLEDGGGVTVPLTRQTAADPDGGKLVLTPSSPLWTGASYLLRVGASLADIKGRALAAESRTWFTTALNASSKRPEIDRAFPAAGVAGGGDRVDVEGRNFVPGCEVRIGGQAAQVLAVSADGTRVTVLVPAGAAGAAAVEVLNPSRLGGARLGAYRYLVAPRIAAIEPPDGSFNGHAEVKITGDGLFGGTQVTFGGRPASAARLAADGALWVVPPEEVTGPVEVAVATPRVGGALVDRKPNGFTFTLKELGYVAQRASGLAPHGYVLLASMGPDLRAIDVSVPESPTEMARVAAPHDGIVTVRGDTAYIASAGEVARYDLHACGSAPLAYCGLSEIDRVSVGTTALSFSGIAASDLGTYVAVAGGNELVLLAPVGGKLSPVAQTFVSGGVIRAVDIVNDTLAVLVEGTTASHLELRSVADGRLATLATVEGLSRPASALTSEGSRLGIAAGSEVRLYDAADVTAPVHLGTWSSAALRYPNALALAVSGPWVLAGTRERVVWLDSTSGLSERTYFARKDATFAQVAVVAGVAAVAEWGDRLDVLEIPYPVLTSASPLPGGAVPPGGSIAVTLSSRLPISTVAGTSVALLDGASVVAGTSSTAGGTARFAPAATLDGGRFYTARVTLGATPYVGGDVMAPWQYPVLGGVPASGVVASAISPSVGSTAGGYTAEISGSGFGADPAQVQVWFGGASAPVEAASDGLITVRVPAALAAGPARVAVARGAEKADVPGGFVYVAPLALSTIAPTVVGLPGGTVKVTGTGFTRGLVAKLWRVVDGQPPPPLDQVVPAETRSLSLGAASQTFDLVVKPAFTSAYLGLAIEQPGAAPLIVERALVQKDLDPPQVKGFDWSPKHPSGKVPLEGVTLTLMFSEPVAPASVRCAASQGAVATVVLREYSGTAAEPITCELSTDRMTLSIHPSSLASTKTYAIVVAGVADDFENAIPNGALGATRIFSTVDVNPPSLDVKVQGQLVSSAVTLAVDTLWTFELVGTDDAPYTQLTYTFAAEGCTPVVLGGGKFQCSWPASAMGTPYLATATVRDSSGNVTTRTVVVNLTNDLPPACVFTNVSPPLAGNRVEEGTAVDLAVTCTDNNRLAWVELRLDGAAMKRLEFPPTIVSTTVAHHFVLPPVEADVARRVVALAGDSAALVGSAELPFTHGPDRTAPAVTWSAPATNARVPSGAALALAATVSDTNGIVSVRFPGASPELLEAPPWTSRWVAPDVSVPTPVVLHALARDPRGNEGSADLTVTVEPVSAAPFVQFRTPAESASFATGQVISVSLDASAQAGIDRIRLSLDGDEVVLRSAPWKYEFVAPAVQGARTATLRAVAVDARGTESRPALRTVTLAQAWDTQGGISLQSSPPGALFAGGSSLRVLSAADPGVVGQVQVTSGGTPFASIRWARNGGRGASLCSGRRVAPDFRDRDCARRRRAGGVDRRHAGAVRARSGRGARSAAGRLDRGRRRGAGGARGGRAGRRRRRRSARAAGQVGRGARRPGRARRRARRGGVLRRAGGRRDPRGRNRTDRAALRRGSRRRRVDPARARTVRAGELRRGARGRQRRRPGAVRPGGEAVRLAPAGLRERPRGRCRQGVRARGRRGRRGGRERPVGILDRGDGHRFRRRLHRGRREPGVRGRRVREVLRRGRGGRPLARGRELAPGLGAGERRLRAGARPRLALGLHLDGRPRGAAAEARRSGSVRVRERDRDRRGERSVHVPVAGGRLRRLHGGREARRARGRRLLRRRGRTHDPPGSDPGQPVRRVHARFLAHLPGVPYPRIGEHRVHRGLGLRQRDAAALGQARPVGLDVLCLVLLGRHRLDPVRERLGSTRRLRGRGTRGRVELSERGHRAVRELQARRRIGASLGERRLLAGARPGQVGQDRDRGRGDARPVRRDTDRRAHGGRRRGDR